jgi:hypothetical protein
MLRVSVLGIIAISVLVAVSLGILDGGRMFLSQMPTSPEASTKHDEFEARILRSTVRFQVNYWVVEADESGYMIESTVGHGTVKDGRFLVTHNHFSQPFSDNPNVNAQDIFAQVRIYSADGTKLTELSGKDVSIVLQDVETLILDLQELNGVGLFEAVGLKSAAFLQSHSLSLTPGTKVAQIDWDGRVAREDWTTVQAVNAEDGVTRLVMSDRLMPGASGGGVFLNGYHLANNWTTVEEIDNTGAIVSQYSTAALDSSQVTTFGPASDARHSGLCIGHPLPFAGRVTLL